MPLWIRGNAHLAAGEPTEAIDAYPRLLAHRGVSPISPHWTLAHLGLGRAHARVGDLAASRRSYAAFFALWKDADPDLPTLIQARREYAALAAAAGQ